MTGRRASRISLAGCFTPHLAMAFLLTLLAMGPAPGTAQISGRVVGSQQQPLPDVAVRVWQTATFLGEVTTDATGRFVIEIDSTTVRRLTFHFPGFETAIIHEFAGPNLVVEMVTSPLRIEGIEAEVKQSGDARCRIDDNPEARRVWADAARRVSEDTGFRGFGYSHAEETRSGTLRAFDARVMEKGRVTRHGSVGAAMNHPLRPRPFEERVRERGYEPAPQHDGAPYEWYTYPSLHGAKAYHFATRTFGELNRLQLLSAEGEDVEIRFCTEEGRPGIQGILRISDGWFESAEWVFTSDRGRPLEAGGEVWFDLVADPAGATHLVAARALRWVADPFRDGYFTIGSTRFENWSISLSGELPPVPARNESR